MVMARWFFRASWLCSLARFLVARTLFSIDSFVPSGMLAGTAVMWCIVLG